MSAATLAHTGIAAALVPQDLLDSHVQQRAGDALQTVGMALAILDMQVVSLRDTRRNGALAGNRRLLRQYEQTARDFADALKALAETNGGPRG